jgi:hypothetical protein
MGDRRQGEGRRKAGGERQSPLSLSTYTVSSQKQKGNRGKDKLSFLFGVV